MNDVIWVCDTCGHQCKSDNEKKAHIRAHEHWFFTPIPEKPKMIQYEGSSYFHCSLCGVVIHKDNLKDHVCDDKQERVSVYATVIKIDEKVLDQIAERVIERLHKEPITISLSMKQKKE